MMNIDELEKQAADGRLVAQGILGICYLYGHQVNVDYERAFELLSAAAARGAPRPTAALASMYANGLGVTKDISAAIKLYEKAVAAGEHVAQIELARIYARADDQEAACHWYKAVLARAGDLSNSDVDIVEATTYLARV